MRCFDWGRSALLRLDKQRYHAEIEEFAELPLRQTAQATADYNWSVWASNFFRRVMSLDYESHNDELHYNRADYDDHHVRGNVFGF